MGPKVVAEAPAMPMGDLYRILREYLQDVRTQESPRDLFHDLLKVDEHGSPKSPGNDALFASAAPESLDWGDAGGKDTGGGGKDGGGRDGGHRGGAHEGHDGGDLTTALSLFKGFGHGDLDL
jgi:hypothetical protein